MKVLLIGEYSRLHNSLKEGLIANGHDVYLAGYGDGFKNFPVDFRFKTQYQKVLAKKLKNLIYRISGYDLESRNIKKTVFRNREKFVGYDIVQLINENSFKAVPHIEREILDFIFKNNKRVFLLSCGTDYYNINYAQSGKLKYSILTPYKEGKMPKRQANNILKYVSSKHIKLSRFILNNINGIIASDIDYHIPLIGKPKYLGMIPNPINLDKFNFEPLIIHDKIIIFHAINDANYFKKGHNIFEKALQLIQKKYSNKIEILEVRSVPYVDFIKSYTKAHIILDQVYSYDQGYTALEAMAQGKVVLTGAEEEWQDYYEIIEDTVCINAVPDAKKIAEKLELLIQNPERILEISRNARKFIEENHNYISIAQKYVDVWNKN